MKKEGMVSAYYKRHFNNETIMKAKSTTVKALELKSLFEILCLSLYLVVCIFKAFSEFLIYYCWCVLSVHCILVLRYLLKIVH